MALIFLRLVVGLHFFNEGITKIRSGSFDAAPFLSQARGPGAGFFQGLIDDHQGYVRLGISSETSAQIDQRPGLAIWEDWIEAICHQNGFDEAQRQSAQRILQASKAELTGFYQDHEVEILAWANGGQRLEGFARDGPWSRQVAREVPSLDDQIDQIDRQRRQTAAGWFKSVEAIWDNFEAGIRDVAPGETLIPLPRPWKPAGSRLAWINRIVPWFDLAVGILLTLGLGTRMAAMAGLCLLGGVLATQPFWVADAANTYYQWIEFAALFLLLAIGAGRFGGLDYFLQRPACPDRPAGTASA